MSPQHLRAELEREFSLVCFEDLAGMRSQHGAIFRLFQSLRLDHFQPAQRLVFYTQHAVDQPFLDHIQRAASRVDISNWFILIVTPHNLESMLHLANQRFGYDSTTISSRIEPIDHSAHWPDPGFADSRHLCPLPFVATFCDPDGRLRPCCLYKNDLGQAQNQSITSAFHGQGFQELRRQMMSGQAPKACDTCWHLEKQGGTSLRRLALQKYGDMLDSQLLDQPDIVDLSWSPASLCNFSCRICNPISSTTIAAEEIKWSKSLAHRNNMRQLIKAHNNTDLQDSVIEQIVGMKQLRFLHILGGEPLLWPKFQKLVELLVDHGLASQITLEINTNASLFPDDFLAFIRQHFAAFEILLSIDNVGTRFELERGGKWDKIFHNIKAFAALQDQKTKVKLSTTINLQNVLYLNDIVSLAENLQVDVLWWYLEKPSYLSINQVTTAMQAEIIKQYINHKIEELRSIAERMANTSPVSGKPFLDFVHELDHRRGQRFADSHSEVFRAMGGCI